MCACARACVLLRAQRLRHLVLHTALDEKAEGGYGSDAVDTTGLRVFADVDIDKSGSGRACLCCRLQIVRGR